MINKYRAYRSIIHTDGVKPLTFIEWFLGRFAGLLLVSVATMSAKRKDNASLNSALLTVWVGNRSDSSQALITEVSPAELRRAIREGRLRLVLDQ